MKRTIKRFIGISLFSVTLIFVSCSQITNSQIEEIEFSAEDLKDGRWIYSGGGNENGPTPTGDGSGTSPISLLSPGY